MHTRLAAALIALAAPLLGSGTAQAHAQLQQATPAVGATIPTAPPQLELAFSEAVEPAFCTITVTNAARTQVDKHDLHIDPVDAKRLALGLPALPPGPYTVTWHATSVDTHKTEGTFTFTVAP